MPQYMLLLYDDPTGSVVFYADREIAERRRDAAPLRLEVERPQRIVINDHLLSRAQSFSIAAATSARELIRASAEMVTYAAP